MPTALQTASALPHIYLSPHLDDAVLSCGGMMAQQIRNGERLIVITLCAGDPPPGPLSPFAQSLHERWNTPANAVALRRAEDTAALRILGAEVIHWDVPDCIYRIERGEHLYASEQALFGDLHPAEAALVRILAARIRALGPARVYAPYTLGHHVDHQLVRRAAELSGAALVFYEDYPYAEREAVLPIAPLTPHLMLLDEASLSAKGRAIAAYPSQVSTFWKDVAEMELALRAFALKTGNGVLAERLWHLP
jgi:LmbE family N-acetylglucosaminyl deacetylase